MSKRKVEIEDERRMAALSGNQKKGYGASHAKSVCRKHADFSKPVAKLRSKGPGKADPIAREQVFCVDCSEGFTHHAGMDVQN